VGLGDGDAAKAEVRNMARLSKCIVTAGLGVEGEFVEMWEILFWGSGGYS
jgi:hypothetical protein